MWFAVPVFGLLLSGRGFNERAEEHCAVNVVEIILLLTCWQTKLARKRAPPIKAMLHYLNENREEP